MQVEKLRISKPGKGSAAARKRQQAVPDAELLTKYQRSLAQFRQQKLARGDKESMTMERLKGFSARLKSGRTGLQPDGAETSTEEKAKDTLLKEEPVESRGDGYDGKVNRDVDHRTYLPAAWRVRSLPNALV
jgi:peptidyl-prolyl cis-trans isomerase SDCCAG10